MCVEVNDPAGAGAGAGDIRWFPPASAPWNSSNGLTDSGATPPSLPNCFLSAAAAIALLPPPEL